MSFCLCTVAVYSYSVKCQRDVKQDVIFMHLYITIGGDWGGVKEQHQLNSLVCLPLNGWEISQIGFIIKIHFYLRRLMIKYCVLS